MARGERHDSASGGPVTPLTLILVAFFGCSDGGSAAGECLQYEPAVVELVGMLREAVRYGPPGYGEDTLQDRRIRVVELALDSPVEVCADPESEVNAEPVNDVSVVQVNVAEVAYTDLLGEHVRVTGTLSRAVLGQQFTPVVLAAVRIDSAP